MGKYMSKLIEAFNNKEHKKAVQIGYEEIDQAPENADLYRLTAASLLNLKKKEEAIKLYKKSIKKIKNNKELFFDLGTIYLNSNNYDEAILYFKKSIKIDKNFTKALSNLGLVFSKLGNNKKAIDFYKKTIKCDPNFFIAIFNLALVHSRENELIEAEKYFKKCLAIDPNHAPSFSNYANILSKMDKYKEAEQLLFKGLNIYPNSKDINKELANLYMKLGFTKKSRDLLKKVFGSIKLDTNISKNKKENINKNFNNFIGAFPLKDMSLCEKIISFFEEKKDLQKRGQLSNNIIDHSRKKTIDIAIHPIDFGKEGYSIFESYITELENIYKKYIYKYSFLQGFKDISISTFNVQKYNSGDHFSEIHCERSNMSTSHRLLAWMTYLNDVDLGGETYFVHDDLKINPKKGETLIWPSDWTHAHAGLEVLKGPKYIITGWIDHQ